MKVFLFAALTLALTCTAVLAQYGGPVRNFRVHSIEEGQITFAWEIESGFTSGLSTFRVYYLYAPPGSSPIGSSSYHGAYYFSSTTRVNTYTYMYTTSVASFSYAGQYIMWLYVARTSSYTPRYMYSEQIYVEVGLQIPIELNIKLWKDQTCFNFAAQSTGLATVVENEVYKALRLYCDCTYGYINYFRVDHGYFSCSSKGFITFRTLIYATSMTYNPSTLVGALKAWLNDKQNSSMLIYERMYYVEKGPCGIQIPSLKAPFCDKE